MKLTANPARLSLPPNRGKESWAKFLRIMKLTTIIILAACLHTSAKGVAQQTITFSGKEVSLESVFSAIKKQTNYRFFFNTDMLATASKVTLDVKNAQIKQVMNMALKDQPLTFTIKGRTIFVMRKVEEEKKSTQVERTGDPITVSGRVTDEQGQPLVGANVKVKGGSNGVTTDAQGRFTLNNVDPNASLEISFVGHETQMLAVKGKTVFSVVLGQRMGVLDETVVIAYGTTTRRLNTGNVIKVKSEDIQKQPVNNPLLALQGRVPGLQITQVNGVPGGGVKVQIQGINSIRSGNEPFYVIDGVPYISQTLSTTSPTGVGILGSSGGPTGSGGGNPLSYINPTDIESIEVLKDADATAIYGSRAANGAILITTKKGKPGRTKVDINALTGWGNVTQKVTLLNTEQYLDMRKEAFSNDGVSIPTRSPDATSNYDITIWDSTRYTDWQQVLLGGTSKYSTISGSVSGGMDNTQFLISGSYHRETLVFPGNFSDQRGSIHVTVSNLSSNKKFKLQLTASYMADKNRLPNSDLTDIAIRLSPNAPVLYNEDGTLNWEPNSSGTSTWTNPLSYLSSLYENKANNLVSNINLSYLISPKLEIKSSFGYNYLQINEFTGRPLFANKPEQRPTSSRASQFTYSNTNSWIIEPQMNYKANISRGKFEAMFGTTFQQRSNDGQFYLGTGFVSDALLRNIQSAPTVQSRSSTVSIYKYNAFFGRVNYNWLDKYLINFTARRDGSSRFGPKNRFHNFGAIGAAWIFSNEIFVKEKVSFLSFGKLRGSYGTTGNDQIGDYSFMNLYLPINTGAPFQNTGALEPRSLPNEYYKWEQTEKLQIGLDLAFVNERILFTANYVRNTSSDQLLQYTLPTVTGFTSILENFPATIRNTALELVLNSANIRTKEFKWNSSINLTIPKNKLVSFPGLEKSSYAAFLIIGQPVQLSKLYQFMGVNSTSGRYQFSDGKDGITSRPDTISASSKTVLYNSLPKFYGGFQNSFTIKGFEIDFLFQFVKQKGPKYIYNNSNIPGVFLGGSGLGNQPASVMNRWQKAGDNSEIQRFSQNTSVLDEASDALNSNWNYEDASFVRLKNVSVGYELPRSFIKKVHVQSFRAYIQCQNVLTITSYSGLDPESQSVASLPPLRIVTIGVQIGL